MKLFDDIKNRIALIGIKSLQSTRKQLFNVTTILILITHIIDLILYIVYIFRVADNFALYVDVIFRIVSLIACMIFFAVLAWNIIELYRLIYNLENIIKKSEFQMMTINAFLLIYALLFIEGLVHSVSEKIYTKTDNETQKRIEILEFAMIKVTPILIILPKFIISFYTYFTTDLREDAFELPIPKW